jgi:hypothetical protein
MIGNLLKALTRESSVPMTAHRSEHALPCTLELYTFKAFYQHEVIDFHNAMVSLIIKYELSGFDWLNSLASGPSRHN